MSTIYEQVRDRFQVASDHMKDRYDVKAEGGFHAEDVMWLYQPQR